jgi:hypothetical protein
MICKGDHIMKKLALFAALAAVVVGAFSVSGNVYAQAPEPPTDPTPASGYGYGMRAMYFETGEYGPLHEEQIAEMAALLGLDVTELEARLAEGETCFTIAEELGISLEDVNGILFGNRAAMMGSAMGMGRGPAMMVDGEFSPQGTCDGSCLVDGEPEPQLLRDGTGGRGGRWH